MLVIRKSLLRGAEEAEGFAVIIDVFRAFTCLPLLYYLGVEKVILERDVSGAMSLKEQIGGAILIGEHNEIPLDGSDLTNSPYQILQNKDLLSSKTVVHRTTAGVNGVFLALRRAERVFMAGFINAHATAELLRAQEAPVVTLVAMGERGLKPSPEDEACSAYIHSLLSPELPYDHLEHLGKILESPSLGKFYDPQRPFLPKEDPLLCLQRDIIPIALEAIREENMVVARPIWMHGRSLKVPTG